MFLFQRLLRVARGLFTRKQASRFNINVDTLRSLESIAEREQRTPEEIANHILNEVLRTHQAQEDSWQRWQTLTPREQDVTALICLNYTTRQIAGRLRISPETVKTHVEHILSKFEVSDRSILRVLLSSWDFSGWERYVNGGKSP
jgi:DNA-binding CsgD family transcriptional regulator